MAKFEIAIPHTLVWEGGWANNPADPGKETNRGITIYTFQLYALPLLSMQPTVENLQNITIAETHLIYKKGFWDLINGDLIKSQHIANIYFDAFVNMGKKPIFPHNSVRLMQRILNTMGNNLKVDGFHGPKTLDAINSADELLLYTNYKEARINYYQDLADNKPPLQVFLKGWLRRINSFPDLV